MIASWFILVRMTDLVFFVGNIVFNEEAVELAEKPLDPISQVRRVGFQLFSSSSATSCSYRDSFLLRAWVLSWSQQMDNSISVISFLFLFKMVRSGLCSVRSMSSGIVLVDCVCLNA